MITDVSSCEEPNDQTLRIDDHNCCIWKVCFQYVFGNAALTRPISRSAIHIQPNYIYTVFLLFMNIVNVKNECN